MTEKGTRHRKGGMELKKGRDGIKKGKDGRGGKGGIEGKERSYRGRKGGMDRWEGKMKLRWEKKERI